MNNNHWGISVKKAILAIVLLFGLSILTDGCVGGNDEAQLQNKAISYMQANLFEDGVWSPGNVEMDQAEETLVDMGAPEFRKGQHALQLIVNLYGVKQSYLVWMQDGEVLYYEMSGLVTRGSLSRSIYPTLKEKGWRSDDTRSSKNAYSQKPSKTPSQQSYSEPRIVQETSSYIQSSNQQSHNDVDKPQADYDYYEDEMEDEYSATQEPKVYSNAYDGFVNIRQEPQSKAPILGVLKNGPDGAVLLGTEGEWKKIDYNGIVGYVYEKYVQDTPTEVYEYWGLLRKDARNYQFTENDLSPLTAKELTYLRNSVYAKHGYVFNSQELNNYFKRISWYHPDASVTAAALNSVERANVEFIKNYQERNGKTYKPQ